MPIARWKDLCIDAVDPAVAGPFWAAALGLTDEVEHQEHALAGPTPAYRVWINRVPEGVTARQRVQVGLIARSVAEYEALGATAISTSEESPWTVMRDPEGGEFCVFVREEPPVHRLCRLAVDSVDPNPVADWWAEVLGASRVDGPGGYCLVADIPGAPFKSIDFVGVSEPKTVKNRIHIDVVGPVAELVAAGARVLRARDDEIGWTVMTDPEGNEFCAFD